MGHCSDTDCPSGECSVEDLFVTVVNFFNSFGRGCFIVVVDVFRRSEIVSNLLKVRCELRLADGCRELPGIAEQECFMLMHLNVRHESDICA